MMNAEIPLLLPYLAAAIPDIAQLGWVSHTVVHRVVSKTSGHELNIMLATTASMNCWILNEQLHIVEATSKTQPISQKNASGFFLQPTELLGKGQCFTSGFPKLEGSRTEKHSATNCFQILETFRFLNCGQSTSRPDGKRLKKTS